MIDFAHFAAQDTIAETFEGQWHAIEFQPELDVPQRFVIGVAMSVRGKLVAYRIAEEAPKLKCFYAQRFSREVWAWLKTQLADELQSYLKKPVLKFLSASPQIYLGQGSYASGTSADSAMSRTFQRIVTVTKTDAKPRNQGVAQIELRETMARIMKLKMSTGFEVISQPAAGLQIKEGPDFHTFDINYDNHVIASSVVSASYASVEMARLNVMTATSDLYRFLKIRKREQIGLAVLLPSTKLLSSDTVATWRTWWANESYKFKESSSILIAESTEPEALAEEVMGWYRVDK